MYGVSGRSVAWRSRYRVLPSCYCSTRKPRNVTVTVPLAPEATLPRASQTPSAKISLRFTRAIPLPSTERTVCTVPQCTLVLGTCPLLRALAPPSHHSLCCICICCVLCRTRYHAPSPIAPLRRPHPSLPIFQLIQTTLRHSRPYILPSSLPSTLSSPYPHPQPDCRVPIVAERLRPVDSLAVRQLYTRSWHRQDPYRSLAPPIAHLRLSDGAVTPGDQRQYRITTFHQQHRPESSS